jgi:AcrR family transcriptional regulator
MKAKKEIEKNPSTEDKIKEAARRVFTTKGYAATRTRDIAEESGFNLALINYYFRSKEKLFDIIMVEHLQLFIHSVMDIVNDPATSLDKKLELVISHYIDMLIANPNLPLFVLNEVSADPKKLMEKIGVKQMVHEQLVIAKQWNELVAKKKITNIDPLHILMNVVSLTIFPFLGSPIIRNRTGLNMKQFNALMEERKKLIPVWVKGMIVGS